MRQKAQINEWYASKERCGNRRDIMKLEGYRTACTNYCEYQNNQFRLYLLRHTENIDRENFNIGMKSRQVKKELRKRFGNSKHIAVVDGPYDARRKGQKPYWMAEIYQNVEYRPTADDVLDLIDSLIQIVEEE